jgi:ferritin-like metal-binding protein YciE
VPVVIVFHPHYIVFHHIKETEPQLSQVNKVLNMISDVLKKDQIYAEMALAEKNQNNVKFTKDVEALNNLIIVQMVHV